MSNETSSLQVLVVDDEERNRKLLGDHVRFLGHKVFFASNGQEALEVLIKEPIDVVLLDLMMPVIDGIQVMKILKRKKILLDLSIIIVSAITEVETKKLAFSNGAFGFLNKPIDRQELITLITECQARKLHYKSEA